MKNKNIKTTLINTNFRNKLQIEWQSMTDLLMQF